MPKNNPDLMKMKMELDSLIIFQELRRDETINKFRKIIGYFNASVFELEKFVRLYADFFHCLIRHSCLSFQDYIIKKIIFSENTYFLKQMQGSKEARNLMQGIMGKELQSLQAASSFNSGSIKELALQYCSSSDEEKIINQLPEWLGHDEELFADKNKAYLKQIADLFHFSKDWGKCVDKLQEFYWQYGSGIFAQYKAFLWEKNGQEGYLRGIESPDPISFQDLIGYENQRSKIIENTLAFLNGYTANNLLLYGDRGTGKSSTVKALLNAYYVEGLRMVEVPKAYLLDFPKIIQQLRGLPQKFIIFVDDLSFEEQDESYTALKAVLEGGLEVKPSNVLIYATSNRRHLIKEKLSDRTGIKAGSLDEEVRTTDTVQEKLSLADRFGMTIIFSAPNKNKYLEIVEGIAARRGIKIEKEELQQLALKWEMWYNGRSPRTARQFVDWLEGAKERF
ncbi:ATP-binding protein [Bacillota bacterium LX-D]|nr:ATP-binding protein [Bacillota bacterium LX-D]